MSEPVPAATPCISCPYRADVPSGVWDAEEYQKLPGYDGEVIDQVLAGATGLFMCHQQDGHLCAGWLGCHGSDELLALRLQPVGERAWGYHSPVPLFESGREACDHGMEDVEDPGPAARKLIDRLVDKKRGRVSRSVGPTR